MLLSVVLPACDEADNLAAVVPALDAALAAAGIAREILVVDDHSTDATPAVLRDLARSVPALRAVANPGPRGFGRAVRTGLAASRGGAVAVMMADGSDAPEDLVAFFRALEKGYDCVFGSRFLPESRLTGYPAGKYVLNRAGNFLVRTCFGLAYDDITNAFKCYRRPVIERVMPLVSDHFDITVELPLKAILAGCSYAVLPNSWTDRRNGSSKLRLGAMLGRYLRIVFLLLRRSRAPRR